MLNSLTFSSYLTDKLFSHSSKSVDWQRKHSGKKKNNNNSSPWALCIDKKTFAVLHSLRFLVSLLTSLLPVLSLFFFQSLMPRLPWSQICAYIYIGPSIRSWCTISSGRAGETNWPWLCRWGSDWKAARVKIIPREECSVTAQCVLWRNAKQCLYKDGGVFSSCQCHDK